MPVGVIQVYQSRAAGNESPCQCFQSTGEVYNRYFVAPPRLLFGCQSFVLACRTGWSGLSWSQILSSPELCVATVTTWGERPGEEGSWSCLCCIKCIKIMNCILGGVVPVYTGLWAVMWFDLCRTYSMCVFGIWDRLLTFTTTTTH